MLLLASPIQKVLISSELVDQHMAPYAVDLKAAKDDISTNKQRIDPFGSLINIDELTSGSKSSATGDGRGGDEMSDRDESSEWYVETLDEGVDHYMFPRTMGYLVLEKQYELSFFHSLLYS